MGEAVLKFAERVREVSSGSIEIQVFGKDELLPALSVFDGASTGAIDIFHSGPYYWKGKSLSISIFGGVPFGMTPDEGLSWFKYGGGMDLWREIYDRYNLYPMLGGNTGPQMGGWFRKEVNTLNDLKGLKMRIPGLGGQVMAKLGVTVQTLPGGEIFQALQTGAIDAAEWVGPYDDEKLGLNKVAKYYYYPGWWEPGATLELQINLNDWNKLPPEYQVAISTATYESNLTMLARYDSLNNEALQRLLSSGTQVRDYSTEILTAAQKASFALYDEFASQDADFKAIYQQWLEFRKRIYAWHKLNEGSFTNFVYSQF